VSSDSNSGAEHYPVPDVGAWGLEMLHWMDPTSAYMAELYPQTMPAGMRLGSVRYGVLLESLDMAVVNSFLYVRARGVGAPASATSTPPRWAFWVMSRLHPQIRRRVATAKKVFTNKIWRDDARRWREIERPETLREGERLQAVNPELLTTPALKEHLQQCDAFVRRTIIVHHDLVFCVVIPLMDFVDHVQQWTGATLEEIFPVFQGASPQSSDATGELAAIQAAADDSARQQLDQSIPADELLEVIRSGGAPFARAVDYYLERVGYRLLNGYDVSHKYALEAPEVLLDAIRRAVDGSAVTGPGRQDGTAVLQALRSRVPTEHQQMFDELFAEAQDTYGIRDERIFVGDAWATGLMRRSILAAGQRLVEQGVLEDPEQLVDARLAEMLTLLDGDINAGKVVVERYKKRVVRRIDQAPKWLGAEPPPPPPVAWLPTGARRVARALNGYMTNLFESPAETAQAHAVAGADNGAAVGPGAEQPGAEKTGAGKTGQAVLRGAVAGSGSYQGVVKIVRGADDLAKVSAGDVVIAVSTSPAFNVILPLVGALVTDRGGLLSHAAIVAREYGIPALVGVRGATETFHDGDLVEVNGGTGEVSRI